MWYSIERNDNTFTITKENIITSVKFRVLKKNCMGKNEEIYFTLITNNSIVYTLPDEDGIYIFEIENGNDTDSITLEIPHYNALLLSLINDIEYVLCGCGCEYCDECNENENELTNVLLKLISYYTLTKNYYSAYLDISMECLQCNIVDANMCLLLHEKISSNVDNTELFKKIISLYYLAFYYSELTDDNVDDINDKYNYLNIIKCIKKLGISDKCIKNKINNMANFTINSSAYINKPPSQVGDYNITIGNRASLTITPAMFTTATTPVYQDPENDPADAVRIDFLPTLGTLEYNGNPVTVGQIISITDVNSGLLIYKSPNQNALSNDKFKFSVRDSGSLQFTT